MIKTTEFVVGAEIPAAAFGPLTIIDTVKWAGFQENSEQIHWDREFAREQAKLPTFIASGAYRQALLARALTDWIGPRGRLLKMKVRHVAPLFEGDTIIYSGRIINVTKDDGELVGTCEVEGQSSDGKALLSGECVVSLKRDGEGG
jgi:acyl dehydratase